MDNFESDQGGTNVPPGEQVVQTGSWLTSPFAPPASAAPSKIPHDDPSQEAPGSSRPAATEIEGQGGVSDDRRQSRNDAEGSAAPGEVTSPSTVIAGGLPVSSPGGMEGSQSPSNQPLVAAEVVSPPPLFSSPMPSSAPPPPPPAQPLMSATDASAEEGADADASGGAGVSSEEAPQKHQLIVNFVSVKCGDGELRAMFEQFGPVLSAKIIRDKTRQKHRGFGFVEFVHPEDAARAMKLMDGFELYEKQIKIGYSSGSHLNRSGGSGRM